jgi:hypothetical protein
MSGRPRRRAPLSQERLDLIGQLGDSLKAEDAHSTPAQEPELDRRYR